MDGVFPLSKSHSNIRHTFQFLLLARSCSVSSWLTSLLDFHLLLVLFSVLMVNRACTVN